MPSPAEAAPGPWESVVILASRGSTLGRVFIVDANGRNIATVFCRDREKLATAALLSLAPQLFELAARYAPKETADLFRPAWDLIRDTTAAAAAARAEAAPAPLNPRKGRAA
jgi:hypothetical protein